MLFLEFVNTRCYNYFSPEWDIYRGRSLCAGAKIASYFLIFPPIIMGAFLGGTSISLSLAGRVFKGGFERAQEAHDGEIYDWNAVLRQAKRSRHVFNIVKKIRKADQILMRHPISGFAADNADRIGNIAAFEASINRTGYGWFFHPDLWINDPEGLHSNMAQGVGALQEAFRLCSLYEIFDAFESAHGPCMDAHVHTLVPLIQRKQGIADLMDVLDMHRNQTPPQRVGEFMRVYGNQKAREFLVERGEVVNNKAVRDIQVGDAFFNRFMTAATIREWCQAQGYLGAGSLTCKDGDADLLLTVDNVQPYIQNILDTYN